MRYLLSSVLLIAALTGCSTPNTVASAPVDLTATNASIDANTAALNGLGGKVDTSSDKVVKAIEGLGTKLDAMTPAAAAAPVKVDPDTCTIPNGMTPTVYDPNTRHVTGDVTDVVRGMVVVTCDVNSEGGWQAWNVTGVKLGTKANGQDGILVDSGNNAVNIDDIRGHYSARATTVKGKKYAVACLPDLNGCKAKKEEKSTTSITVVLPKGAKIVTGGS